jgi:sugar lactone lactonase YvrE
MQKIIVKTTRFQRIPRLLAVATIGALSFSAISGGVMRAQAVPPAGDVSTLAGTGIPGFADGPGSSAVFKFPRGVAADGSGNVYVADYNNHRIRKIDSEGVVSTLAGNGVGGFADGTGTSAKLFGPSGVGVDGSGNVYVAENNGNRIRKIDSSGVVSTLAGDGTAGFADGTGASAKFNQPAGVAVDRFGNVLVADGGNFRIRIIDSDGAVGTFAGTGTNGFADGPAASAKFNLPTGVAVDGSDIVYVADTGNHRIRKIDSSTGLVSTVAGDGTAGFADGAGTSAKFNAPRGVAVDGSGNLYVADTGNYRIRKIDSSGVVSTLAGIGTSGFADGSGTTAQFDFSVGVAVDGSGNVYVGDTGNSRIRKIASTVVTTTTTTTAAPTTTEAPTTTTAPATTTTTVPYCEPGQQCTTTTVPETTTTVPATTSTTVPETTTTTVPETTTTVPETTTTTVPPVTWDQRLGREVGVATVGQTYRGSVHATGGPYTGYYVAPLLSPSIAESAVATASGAVSPQTAAMAIDRVATGYPADFHREWASGGGVGGWIQLNWETPQNIDRIALYDRPNLVDQITGGELIFDDESTVIVGALNNDGTATSVSFTPRTTRSVRFTITGSRTNGAGLAEFQAWATGTPQDTRPATLLPPGITLNNTTGAFSGTPTTTGSYPFLVIASGATFPTIAQTLIVNAAPTTTTTPATTTPATTTPATTTPATTTPATTTTTPATPAAPAQVPAPIVAIVAPTTTKPEPPSPAPANPAPQATASAPASSAPVNPTPTPVSPADRQPQATVEAGSHVEGQAVTVKGSGYRPGSVVTVVLPSTGATLGTATADTNGAFSLNVTLPAGTTGKRTVRVLGESIQNGPSTVNTEIVVAPASPQELAFTGSQTALLLTIATGLLLAGLIITCRSRKQRP